MMNPQETQSHVERRGYKLVPDYASTSFMMQGTSLDAGFADCGDIESPGSISKMTNSYVILSRFKNAAGLALLRAFSSELFATGVSPGPHCLLKLLRSKKSTSSNKEEKAVSYKSRSIGRIRIQSWENKWTV